MILTPITNPIDTKADKVHTHTTAQVTGLDAALTDANWHKGAVPGGATLDDLSHGTYHIQGGSIAEDLGLPARVGSLEISPGYYGTKTATAVINLLNGTSHEVWTNTQNGNSREWMGWRKSVLINPASSTTNLDLRLDTTVGTRIFAGDTMIYGDTGRRSVPDLTTSLDVSTSGTHGLHIRRVGGLVTLTGSGRWIAGQWVTETLPLGFRPHNVEYLSARGIAIVDATTRMFGNSGTLLRLSFPTPFPAEGVSVGLNASWYTDDPWPSTLPGLPA